MNPFMTLRVAMRALLRNKMRSFLTTLGIIIGVAAVIAMVAIGEGAKARVEAAFSAMGTNLLIVMPGSTRTGGVQGGSGSNQTLTWEDLRAIQTEVNTVKAAAPQLRSSAQLMSEEQNWSTSVYGTSTEYFDIRSWPPAEGSVFSQSDIEGGTKVIVLGRSVADKLFGQGSSPIGQSIRVRNIPFQVIGVLSRKGQSAMGQDYDDSAYIPYTTFRSKIQGGLVKFLSGSIMIEATASDTTAKAQREVTALLRDRHRLSDSQDDDFSIRNLAEIASAQQEGTETMTTLLAAVAAVSLLVGGIGIMNIMLVSVTERTREIGLRMAIGARRYQILLQFLVESLVLAFIGGIIGVALGVGSAKWLAAKFGWDMLIRPDVAFIAVVFSALTGVVFGLYPARKASRLDPIDALRYE